MMMMMIGQIIFAGSCPRGSHHGDVTLTSALGPIHWLLGQQHIVEYSAHYFRAACSAVPRGRGRVSEPS